MDATIGRELPRNLTLANLQSTYAHNDPAGACTRNAFFSRLVPLLEKVALQK